RRRDQCLLLGGRQVRLCPVGQHRQGRTGQGGDRSLRPTRTQVAPTSTGASPCERKICRSMHLPALSSSPSLCLRRWVRKSTPYRSSAPSKGSLASILASGAITSRAPAPSANSSAAR